VSDILMVTGASGMLGRAVMHALGADGGGGAVQAPGRAELDLLDAEAVRRWLGAHRPGTVVHLAGHVRGLAENMGHQTDGLVLNARMGLNVLAACAEFPPERLVVAGSTAAYGFPYAHLPLREDDLLAGDVHPGEHGYASAHRLLIAGAAALARDHGIDVRVGILTNMFGPGDRFAGDAAHAVPALIARFVAATANGDGEVVVWGSPLTTRDFLYVDDAAEAVVAMVRAPDCPAMLNVASGQERTMGDVVQVIAAATGFDGTVTWDANRPVGIPRRSVDISRLQALDLPPAIGFEGGVRRTVDSYHASGPS
jgi:GDP-L-fucose synthase